MFTPPDKAKIFDISIYWVDGLESFAFFVFLEGANDESSAALLKFW